LIIDCSETIVVDRRRRLVPATQVTARQLSENGTAQAVLEVTQFKLEARQVWGGATTVNLGVKTVTRLSVYTHTSIPISNVQLLPEVSEKSVHPSAHAASLPPSRCPKSSITVTTAN
jgi:hypothetical protein